MQGLIRRLFTDETITLDGSGSTDLDGDPLTFAWKLVITPVGSAATLSSPSAVMPTFIVDVPGSYVAELVVNDTTDDSELDTVTITTDNSAPVADAGPDQIIALNNTVTLDGSGSTDVDGDELSFFWLLTTIPNGSLATLSDPQAVMPTFFLDVPGTYVAQLTVSDGILFSKLDTVTINTENLPPVADAGPDQSVFVEDTVQLDGSSSSDVNGDVLSFSWALIVAPNASTATLSNSTAVNPTFSAELPGTYVAQLIVNDGAVDSPPDTVAITTQNSAPVADAGPDQTIFAKETVQLNGSGSSDVDGDGLTFIWSLTTVPQGSLATLSDSTVANPTFTADLQGTYIAQLIVNDGELSSDANTVMITTENSVPVADAGPDQAVLLGNTVQLDGSGSSDVDGDGLTFIWSLTTAPQGSLATLSDSTVANPTFTADLQGTYIAQLIVNDGELSSDANTVMITTENSVPVADAGPDQAVLLGNTVQLDGSGSSDANENSLTFIWSLVSVPDGSLVTLSASDIVDPTFVADLPGTYVAQLIVNDGIVDSAPDNIVISTQNIQPVADAGADQMVFVSDMVQLDGSGSSDVDGDSLTFNWSLTSVPTGSAAAISDFLLVNPTFTADLAGTYVAQLVVNDGAVDSAPDTVMVEVFQIADTITLTATSTQMVTQNTLTMTANINGLADVGGQSIDLLANNALVTVPANVTIPEGQTSVDFDIQSGVDTGSVNITASATDLTGDIKTINVQARSFSLSNQLVGIDRTVTGTITLAQPALTGGASFAMSVGNTSVMTVSPASVTIPQGETIGTFDLTGGLAPGETILTANGSADGF